MATIISPSSPDDDAQIPTATLALPSMASASASRRIPPPCWTPEETAALIDAYRDKWYSLRRSNLRANHWQEVAEEIASVCPADPPKTALQCRHKMEKLRKRYRGEIQRRGGARHFTSSWAHFQNMHSMEKGTDNPSPPSSNDDEEEIQKNSIKRINDLYNNHNNQNPGSTPGVRIKIPGGLQSRSATAKVRSSEMNGQNPNPSHGIPNSASIRAPREGFSGKRTVETPKLGGGVGEVAAAIQAMGEGFMRIEKVKMEMAREIEEMRMEMELKRTEMILDSQQRIMDAFAKGIYEGRSKKKTRKNGDYS